MIARRLRKLRNYGISKFKKVTNLKYLIYKMIYHLIYYIWYDISCCISLSSKLKKSYELMIFDISWGLGGREPQVLGRGGVGGREIVLYLIIYRKFFLKS